MLALISAVFFIPVFITYIQTGLVPNFPTLIVCGFTFIAAILSFFCGLLLSTMSQKSRHDFEYRLIAVNDDFKRKLNADCCDK